jgi:hypothetical protein
MQGKFQLVVLPAVGHIVQEDVRAVVCKRKAVLLLSVGSWRRHQRKLRRRCSSSCDATV